MLQRSNFRLMLYDKRYAVFLSVMGYIAGVAQTGRVEDDDLIKLMRNSKDKEFLFGSEVGEYVQSLYSQGAELMKVSSLLDAEKDQANRETLAKQKTVLFSWFELQFDTAKKRFEPYLAIRSK